MINVTTAFRKALYDEIREYENSVVITLANGTVLNVDNEHIMSNGLEIEDAISNDDDFTALGSTIINTATIVLYNNDEIYSDYDFVNAKVVVYTTLANERIKKGTFTIDDATYSNATITLYVLDNMEQFDRPYSLSNLVYPATLGEIVRDACQVCDITLNSNSQQFPHYNFTIDERPDDESITFREVIGYAATIAGCYARCDVDGKLEFKWFNVAAFETDSSLDGGTFSPWTTGGYTDGGTFSPWTTGTEISDNEFTTRIIPHYITSLYSQDIGVDDVVITGVKIFIEVDDEEGGTETESYLAGSEGYIIQIENNPFINKSNVSTVLGWISTVVVGLRFRKCNVTHPNDPCIEAGDIGYVWDTKGVEHPILITRVTFSPNSPQTIVCGAQTPSRNSASRFSELTKSYVDARRQLRKQRDSYQAAMDDLKEQIENANGLYETQVTQQDGSIITYLHNKPLLEESDTRIMISSVGVTVTPDAGQHWYGLTVDGTFLASVINTIGLFFDYAHGGTLTLGGQNNTNGRIRILNSSGTQIGLIDNTGAELTGNITLAQDTYRAFLGTVTYATIASNSTSPNYYTATGFGILDTDTTYDRKFSVAFGQNRTYLSTITTNQYSNAIIVSNPTMSTRHVLSISELLTNAANSEYYDKYIQDHTDSIMWFRIFANSYFAYLQLNAGTIQYSSNTSMFTFSVNNTTLLRLPVGAYISISTTTRINIYGALTATFSGNNTFNMADNTGIELASNKISIYDGQGRVLDSTTTGSNIRWNGMNLAFDTSSSKRYKHNITLLKNKTLDPHRLYDLVVKQYRYNDDAKLQYPDMKDQTLPGFIAEDVAKIYPAAVIHDNETGQIESWDERRIVPGMLALIQEQKKLIDELTERVNKLEGII